MQHPRQNGSDVAAVPVTSTFIYSLPRFPGRVPAVPKCLQDVLLPQRIHALPEGFMAVRHQLAISRELLHRRVLEHVFVAADVIA